MGPESQWAARSSCRISGIAEVSWQEAKGGDSPGGPVVKNLPANAGNMGAIPGSGRFYMFQGS